MKDYQTGLASPVTPVVLVAVLVVGVHFTRFQTKSGIEGLTNVRKTDDDARTKHGVEASGVCRNEQVSVWNHGIFPKRCGKSSLIFPTCR